MNLVEEKLKTLPENPGVYLMKNSAGKIIYVGKAKILKNRVRQYFQKNKNHSPKVLAMVKKISDFETIVTASEVEALILECNLIKKFRPRYNISLKDDKTYPFLKITSEKFPRILITRKKIHDGAKYFGSYTNGLAVKETLQLLRKIFPEYEKLFSDAFGVTSLELLALSVNSQVLADLLQKASRDRFGIDKANQIQEFAKNSFGIIIASSSLSLIIR